MSLSISLFLSLLDPPRKKESTKLMPMNNSMILYNNIYGAVYTFQVASYPKAEHKPWLFSNLNKLKPQIVSPFPRKIG